LIRAKNATIAHWILWRQLFRVPISDNYINSFVEKNAIL